MPFLISMPCGSKGEKGLADASRRADSYATMSALGQSRSSLSASVPANVRC
jgi:hypothetical protein